MSERGGRSLRDAVDPRRSLTARLALVLSVLLALPLGIAAVLLARAQRSVDAALASVVETEARRKTRAELHRAADIRREELEAEAWELARLIATAGRLAEAALHDGQERTGGEAALDDTPGAPLVERRRGASVGLLSRGASDRRAALADLAALARLETSLGTLLAEKKHVAGIRVETRSGACRVFPARDLSQLLASGRIRQDFRFPDRWPVRSPGGQPPVSWLPVHAEPSLGRGRLVTALAPVYRRDGSLCAQVAVEWALEELLTQGAGRLRADEGEVLLDGSTATGFYSSATDGLTGPDRTRLQGELAGLAALSRGESLDRAVASAAGDLFASVRHVSALPLDYARYVRVAAIGEEARARIAPVLETARADRRRALLVALLLGLLAAVPAGLGAGLSLGPLRRLAAAAEGLASAAADAPLPGTDRDDELGRVARSLDAMRRRLFRRDGQLGQLSGLAREASASAGLSACCGQVARAAAGLAGAEKAFVCLHDPARRGLAAVVPGFGIPDETLRGFEVGESQPSLAFRVLRTGQPYLSNDLAADPKVSITLARRLGIRRNLAFFPLRTEGGTAGVLVVADKPGSFDADDEAGIAAAADQGALLIRSARLYSELQSGFEQLREAYRNRDRFIQDVNHELRTPLTAILGWSEILSEDGPDPETSATATQQIRRSAQYLDALIADLLDLARLQEGSARIERARADLGRLVTDAVDAARGMAEAKRITLRVSAPEPGEAELVVDGLRIRQVLWNLVHNAVKFTHRGGHIDVEAELADGTALLTVTDDGIGVDPKDLPFIFDRYRQGEGGRARIERGSGIGLSLARAYVDLHGGRIDVQSGPGRGTRFSVRLPAAGVPREG